MIRAILDEVALFLVPFAVFGLALVLTRRRVLDIEHWSRHALWLSAAGLGLVLASFLVLGLFAERHTGRYVPPHMEDGRPVPGGFQ